MIVKYILPIVLFLSMSGGLVYLINERAELKVELENKNTIIEDTNKALDALGSVIHELGAKYANAGNKEFDTFEKIDINKVNFPDFVNRYNVGIKRVLKDYNNQTAAFTSIDPETPKTGN